LDTHVNKENVRNGFFELDWNDEFVVQLKQAGYGLMVIQKKKLWIAGLETLHVTY
jgi:hypothetical protein